MASYEFAWQASLTDGSTILVTAGSLDAVKLTSFTTGTIIYRRVTLPAYASSANIVTLWDYTQGDWSTFIVQVTDAAGYCVIADRADIFTAGAPAGTAPRVQATDVSCFQPYVRGPNAVRCHATLSTATGVDGSGIPTILTDAGTAAGKYRAIYAKNASTTTATEIDVWILG
ncbi:MAG: hypothetical protein EBR82_48780 [Caulobacteraceae bacterium]|nr:hypothetical protein [Caulobacteraceae bacterium]